MRDHKKIFTEIYEKNVWGGGSGGGSTPENTLAYRGILQQFLKDKNIRTVMDYGCGDWSFSHLIDWRGIDYLGVDCVESVIDRNCERFITNNIKFVSKLPLSMFYGDLLILKDVLQHWTFVEIYDFMDMVTPNFPYILITNTVGDSGDGFISLYAKEEPLKDYKPKVLAYLHTSEVKEISLITRP